MENAVDPHGRVITLFVFLKSIVSFYITDS